MLDLDELARLEAVTTEFAPAPWAILEHLMATKILSNMRSIAEMDTGYMWSDSTLAEFLVALRNAAPALIATARAYDTLSDALIAFFNSSNPLAAIADLADAYERLTGKAAASGQRYTKHAPPPEQTDQINAALIGNDD